MMSDDSVEDNIPSKQQRAAAQEVIDILSDNDSDAKPRAVDRSSAKPATTTATTTNNGGTKKPATKKRDKANSSNNKATRAAARPLQAGLVLEEDIDDCVQRSAKLKTEEEGSEEDDDAPIWTLESYRQHQEERKQKGNKIELYHDSEFESTPASIEGASRQTKVEKCRCSPSLPVALSYITKGQNKGRPYHRCPKTIKSTRCRYFRWAFQAERMHWYRFGPHTNHVLVGDTGFSANDLLQGRVGDCWFLSALAVIAEREDLIARIFGGDLGFSNNNPYGIVQVNLFLDGYWKRVTMDNFLPCIIGEKGEQELEAALKASLGIDPTTTTADNTFQGSGYTLSSSSSSSSGDATKEEEKEEDEGGSSKFDPFAMSDKNRQVLSATENFLQEQKKAPANPYAKKPASNEAWRNHANSSASASALAVPSKLNRIVTTEDLAYSKAKNQQLWVPFLEKAYAKSHGSYQSISGGWIAEAFLDLTGAPTLAFDLHNDPNFDPRRCWYQLLSYRRQRLPMGCCTSSSAGGLIGMHAYSVIDVREVKNVGLGFFHEKLADRTLGNVSGFTTFDGTVRLLRIRNPHGKGEWKGEFSDQSDVWEKLLNHKQEDSQDSAGEVTGLERTHRDDGSFWMDYDAWLMGFFKVEIVLAYQGNCARSFHCNFPEKKSNHRSTRAFEVSLLDPQPGVPLRDTVELYAMAIQKTRRGASHGRADRKVSYKLSDMGILVGESQKSNQRGDEGYDEGVEFYSVNGEMMGFKRNGHHRLILNRKTHKRLVVMPISFGHPAATDKDKSFVLRFVADSPLLIRELPNVPPMDRVLQTFCFPSQPHFGTKQRKRKVLLEDKSGMEMYGEPLYRVFQIDCLANQGGVVFIYLCVNERLKEQKGIREDLDLSVEATCRGMMCRTETGFLQHETLAKGKKFEAAWRKFSTNFYSESATRLLMVLVQSGQDTEMGSVSCTASQSQALVGGKVQAKISSSGKLSPSKTEADSDKLGIFTGIHRTGNKETHDVMFGQIAASISSSGAGTIMIPDLDLERALALSRGDIEMTEALELSKRDTGPFSPGFIRHNGAAMNQDHELQLALERSKADKAGSSSFKRQAETIDVDTFGDDDLKEAIKRSLEATNPSSHKKAEKSREPEVIDLDAAENHESAQAQKPSPKRQKVDEPVIVIIDDDDEEEVRDADDSGTPQEQDTQVSAADKRRLAAEAAEKRVQPKVD